MNWSKDTLLILSIASVFISCARNDLTRNKNSKPSVSIKGLDSCSVDSFYIWPKSDLKTKYTSAWSDGKNARKYFFNYPSKSFDYLDFNNEVHVELFKVENALEDKIQGVAIISRDSIIFLLNSGLAIYNDKGYKMLEYEFDEDEVNNWEWDCDYNPPIYTGDGLLYSRRHKFQRKSVSGYYSFKEKKIIPIPHKFPKPRKGNVGLLNQYSQIYFKNKVATLFNPYSEIYVYDLISKEEQKYDIRSSFDSGFLPLLNKGKIDVNHHFVTSGNYYRFVYNPFRNQFYIVYLHPQALKNDFGYFNDPFLNRNVSLIVIDDDFENKREYVFSSSFFWFHFLMYPTAKGIIVKAAQTRENYQQMGTKHYIINCP